MEVEKDAVDVTKIRCLDMPEEFLQKSVARQYFEQFGEVQHIIIKTKSKICYIHYKNYEDAQRALFNANFYQGKKLNISKYNTRPKTRQPKKDNDSNWLPNSEVQRELAAMASTNEKSVYTLRQEAMAVDSPSRPSSSPVKKTKQIEKPKLKNGWTPEQLELLGTIKQVTHTTEDKYKVLEARDKLMRLRLKKLTNMDKATKGTCPDMCPEKERLQREIQHQVAPYEQDAVGKCMNPYLAIKQYSRSSADQEAPLAHELRPVATLELSMGYLTHNIMNLCDLEDVNLAEWYHFLWDRTRSIRKDITQQELCCHGSVALLEQCARFHIHCSARLVAEDPSVFDQKINTENLTKCLQTLKYMYHDLELKGESCEHEAEFRAYIILLNLNDGNFMWEVQQLKLNIQRSLEVKFALEVYSALDKNNFVKFFKLVRSTNYLNSCILLRYFIQVRATALSTILKCYSPRTPYTQFPLSELQHLLAFEDAASLTEFLASFGLYLNQDESQVILDRKAHQEPEIPITLDRAINVVESKRVKSVGEVVCGGVLPPPLYTSYVPHNSFAENGVLIITDTLKEIVKEAEIPSKFVEQARVESVDQPDGEKLSQPLPFWAFKNESIFKTKADSPPRLGIFGGTKSSETARQFTFKMPQSATAQQKSLGIFPLPSKDTSFAPSVVEPPPQKPIFNVPLLQKNQNESIIQSFFGSDIASTSKAPDSKPTIFVNPKFEFAGVRTPAVQTAPPPVAEKAETNMVEVLRLKEEEAKRKLMERAAEEKREQERWEKLRLEELARMKEEALRKENERCKREREEEMEKRRIAILVEKERQLRIEINKTVTELLNDLLTRVEAIRRDECLNDIATNIRNFKTRQFFALWQKKCRLSKRKRHAIDQNPVWLPERSVSEEAAQLRTANQGLMLHDIKRYKTGKSCDIVASEREQVDGIDMSYYYKLLLASYTKMQTRLPKELFWKVTVSLPDFKEVKIGLSVIENVLMQYFQWKDRYGSTARVDQYHGAKLLGYCIERKQGVVEVDSNSNGIVFLTREPNDHLYQRILFAVKKFPSHCRLAIAVVFINDESQSINSQKLGMLLEKNSRITNYKVITCQFNRQSILSAVKESLDFLSENIQTPPPLELDMLGSFVNSHLAVDLWNRMRSCSVWNANYKACLKSPNLVIGLYNQAIDKLKEIVSDHTCLDYPSFPIEFDLLLHEKTPEVLPCNYRFFPSFWRKATYRSLLRKTLNSLLLPKYESLWPPQDQSTLEKDLFAFCSSIFKKPQRVFYNIMAIVLKNYDPSRDYDRIKNLLWIDILGVISAEKLQEANFLLRHTPFHAKSTFTQLFVVYKTGALERFKSEEWFYVENSLVKSEMKKLPEKVYVNETTRSTISVEDIDIDAIEGMMRADKTVRSGSSIDKLKELEEFMNDLETSMDIHKQINATFRRTVNQALGIRNEL